MREVGAAAAWRGEPLGHYDVLARIRQRGALINPLLEVPWVQASVCRADWLHVADQGVAADFIGNALWVLQARCPGRSLANRVAVLSTRLQQYYEQNNIAERVDVLLPSLFSQPRQGFKLRASAAKTRAMVPFIDVCCRELLADGNDVEQTVTAAAACLRQVYATLAEDSFLYADVARSQSINFALLWLALHDVQNHDDDRCWRLKPKLHLFLHICSDGSRPARHWNYRDEDYGGAVARAARRRGGVLSAPAVSKTVLERFWMQHPHFRMV